MGKLLNSNKWDKNDIRILIVMLLITVYPVLAGSFFMVFVFFIMPYQTAGMWPHLYWLIATAAWVLLLALILPMLRDDEDKKLDSEGNDGKKRTHVTNLQMKHIETASKIKPLSSNVKVEKTKEVQDKELAFEMKQESINEKTDKECLDNLDACEKSQKIKRSHVSLDNSQVDLRASWGFLNSSLESLAKEKSSDVINTDRKSRNVGFNNDQQKNITNEVSESEIKFNGLREEDIFQEDDNIIEDENKIQNIKIEKINADCTTDEEDHTIKDKERKNESIDIKKELDNIDTISGELLCMDNPCGSKSITEETQVSDIIEPNVEDSKKTVEIDELEEAEIVNADLEIYPVQEEKGSRSVDRSRNSGYIENSVPWSPNQVEKNAVFIFIKPEVE